MDEAGEDLSWSSLSPQKGLREAATQDHVCMAFECLKGWRLHNLSLSPPRGIDPALILETRFLRVY